MPLKMIETLVAVGCGITILFIAVTYCISLYELLCEDDE